MSVNVDPNSDKRVIIIGGGPAGLTAAYELTKFNLRPIVCEKLDKVGGIARTENYKGFLFDMGGHRFYTKSEEINTFWREILGDEFLLRPRLSRIYYNHKFFYYPLKPFNALFNLGLWPSILVVLSYIKWQFFPYRHEETFEEWVTNRFGKRLFLIFFKEYTEKVWGISTSELKAEWAAQRIKDLSLKTAILNMLIKNGNSIKTLIEEFHYPRYGPGMLWDKVKDEIEKRGGGVKINSDVVEINRSGNRIDNVVISCNGHKEIIHGTDFISSMHISQFIKILNPRPPQTVLEAAKNLKVRDFLTVCLIVNKPNLFPDNWIYVHDPGVKVGRIQNFNNWSPGMAPDPTKTSLGLEYFCNQGDELWSMSDYDLIELGKREIENIKLAKFVDIVDGCVFRVENSYPVYDTNYRKNLEIVRRYIESLENLQTIGRNGLHRYDNQDHAMITGMLAVRNLLLDEKNDLWSVNTDQDYVEEVHIAKTSYQAKKVVEKALAQAFMKLDPKALGISWGIMSGSLLLFLTLIVVNNNMTSISQKLWLLTQYFPGYRVTNWGSVVGLFYGILVGFILGWIFAFLRNAIVLIYMVVIQKRAELHLLRKLLDF